MKSKTLSNWWVLAFNGIIALLFGLMAIFSPLETMNVIVMYFGFVMIIVGIAMAYVAYINMKNQLRYGRDLISSFITIGLGIVLAFFTERSMEILVLVVGIWAVILGISQLIIMMNIHSPGDKRMLLINGIITIAFGIILFFNPFASAAVFIVLTGILAVMVGIILIVLSIKLKNLV